MNKKNILLVGGLILLSTFTKGFAYDLSYNHGALKYTQSGVQIYSMSAKDFLSKGFAGEVDYIKNQKNGAEIKYVLGQTGDILGTDKNDYFYGFDNYRTNNLIGGLGDDFYDCQHTYPIVEKPGEGIDTYYTAGNTGPGKDNVENIISAGAGGRIYGNDQDNLIITEGKGSEIHGNGGNDVFLVNGLKDNFYGEDGIDTIIFPGSVSDYVINGDQRGVNVKNIKTGGFYRLGHHDIEQYQFDDTFFGYEAGENTLQVGPTKTFKKVSDAIHVAGNGDTLEVDAGIYEDDFAIIDKNITIIGKGGKAKFYAKSPSFKGKANFITMSANVTFDNVEFYGNKVADKNGAGIRMEGSIPGGIITVKNSYFHDNEVGILAGNQTNGVLNIENTEFGYNGNPTSVTHTVNVGVIKELNVKNSFFHNSKNGHNIRSLAGNINVNDSFFYDGTANTSFNIEVAQANNVNIIGNTFVQTENAENTHMILNNATVSSTINGNTFVNNSSRGEYAIMNNSTLPINLNNNKLYNYKGFIGGNNKFNGTGNEVLQTINITIPTSNGGNSLGTINGNTNTNSGTTPSQTSDSSSSSSQTNNQTTPTQPTIITDAGEFSKFATLSDFNGKNITVGVGKNYLTLKEAVLNAVSGDKIYVDEGVYKSDYAIVSNKNIAIIGLGNGAEFKKVDTIPNGKAILVSYKSNVYLKNIIFSDSEVPDKNGAGIRYEGGTLTIENCIFKNNENGILGGATDIGKGKIWINNSKFLDNGKNGTGYTHAIYIGEMDYFEIKNSTVSATAVGHHVKSRARTNVIENNILDDAGKDSSYNIDLPNGGEGLIKGNTIIQSINSPNRTMVSYSAEKNPPNAGKLIVENNLFESEGTTAIGVKNFRDNQVILKNNIFKNVSTKYVGNNITEENPNILPQNQIITSQTGSSQQENQTGTLNEVSQVLSQSLTEVKQESQTPKITLMAINKDLTTYETKIDSIIKSTIEKNKLTSEKIDKITLKVDNKIKLLEEKSLKRSLSPKENRTYFLLQMIKDSLTNY